MGDLIDVMGSKNDLEQGLSSSKEQPHPHFHFDDDKKKIPMVVMVVF
jgi:hypothetical protein